MSKVNAETKKILVLLISIAAGFLAGAVIMLLWNYNPILAHTSIFSSALGNMNGLGETIREAAPPIFTVIGFSVVNSTGSFNIGLSGQAQGGWLAAIWIVFASPHMPEYILLPYAIIVGTPASAAITGVAGVLRIYSRTNGVIATIMVNYIVLYSYQYLMQNVMSDRLRASTDATKTVTDSSSLQLDRLNNVFGDLRINAGIFLALIALVAFWFTMKKTVTGSRVKAVGLNPFVSRYARVSAKRNIIVSMLLSDAFAGLSGVIQGLRTYQDYFTQTTSVDISFDGMSASLSGGGIVLGILLAAFPFSILKIGGLGMQTLTGIPYKIASIVIAAIIFFAAISYIVGLLFGRKKKNYNQPETIAEVLNDSVDDPAVKTGEGGEV